MKSSVVAPTTLGDRITSLDTIRGVAVLGILTMNAVSYGFVNVGPYFNIDASSPQSWLDWIIGATGEIFFDQKFMALFSMLFGAGIALFADRAAAKAKRATLLSLWRNLLLLVIGLAHTALWVGDVLVLYALCSPVLLVLRKRSPRFLLVAGGLLMLVSPVAAIPAQATIGADGGGLGEYWGISGEMSDAVGLWILADLFGRALAMMLIGVALYRTGFLSGTMTRRAYRRFALWGAGVGLLLSAGGFAWVAGSGFSPGVALIGTIPNTVATIAVSLGYASLIILWHKRTTSGALNARVRDVGRMALTNYLTQTVLGVVVLRGLFDPDDISRTWLVVFIGAVWALQLWWSRAWLARFRYGPAEWTWRLATYRRIP